MLGVMTSQPLPEDTHAARIRTQFTQQAEPFEKFGIHSAEESLLWLAEELQLAPGARVLDAGCGPGLVATYLAPACAEVVGVDATPAMVERGRQRARSLGLANVTFTDGLLEALPFGRGAFDGVVTRYTLHHVLGPGRVMDELVRVTRPGGRVVVCDAAPRAECRDRYDAWERLRDSSHSSACTPDELRTLAHERLDHIVVRDFRLAADVEALLATSFPVAGALGTLRELMSADVDKNELDMDARYESGRLFLSFPIRIVAGTVRQ